MFDPYGESPSFYQERMVTGRKEYKCGECGRMIAKGERQRYAFIVYTQKSYAQRTCAHCCIAQDWLIRECDGYLFEGVREDLEDHVIGAGVFNYTNGYGSGPARLVVGMRKRWQRFDCAGLMPIPVLPPDRLPLFEALW